MIGIGNYVLGDDRSQATMPSSGGGGGGAGWPATITSISTSIFGPGGLPGLIGAARGGGGAPATAAPAAGGGGFDIGKVVPFALIGIAVIGGFFLIKKLRKKA